MDTQNTKMNRFELIEEIVRLCKESGYAPDEIKLRKKLSEYSTPCIPTEQHFQFAIAAQRWLEWERKRKMALRSNCPCDIDGVCPYEDMHSGYFNSCEYWCGDDEPQDDPADWEEYEDEMTDAEREAEFIAASKLPLYYGREFWEDHRCVT